MAVTIILKLILIMIVKWKAYKNAIIIAAENLNLGSIKLRVKPFHTLSLTR